jgi:hypothetical protein
MKGMTMFRTQVCIALASAACASLAYAQPNLTLAVEPEGSGFVARFPGAIDFEAGDIVTVTATPEPGFEFVGWVGAVESPDSSVMFQLNEDAELTAVFQEIVHEEGVELFALTAFVEPSGAGSIVREPALFDYEDGQEVTLQAFAGEGFVFTEWSGDLPEGVDPSDPVLVVAMSDNLDVRANFAAGLTLQDGADADTNGVEPGGDSESAPCGSMGALGLATMFGLMLSLKLGRSRFG